MCQVLLPHGWPVVSRLKIILYAMQRRWYVVVDTIYLARVKFITVDVAIMDWLRMADIDQWWAIAWLAPHFSEQKKSGHK